MRRAAALLLLLGAACRQEDAPAEDVAEAAEALVAPESTSAPLAKGPLAPRDECGEVEGAAEFRERLAAAVKARDADAVAALAARDIKLDFGGGEGADELKARLQAGPELWQALDQLLGLGCAANEEGGITLPWLWEQDLGVDDPYVTVLVMGEDVPVLKAPSASAERDGAVSWDIVEAQSFDPALPYQQVKLGDGGTGYIATDKLRSLIDYRLIASSRNGKWSMTAFIAGD